MRKYIVILLALMAFPYLLSAQNELKQQADEAYRQADYQTAAKLYEEILGQGVVAHEVYYNLGCTYYRLNELGASIVNFERALRLKPNDKDTRENLDFCYSRTQDQIQQLPQSLITTWWHALATSLATPTWYVVLLAMVLLLCVFVAWFMLSKDISQRRGTLIGSVATLALLLLTLGCTLQSRHDASNHDNAIVMQPQASVKASPDPSSNDKFSLHEGTRVTIEETIDQWYRIRLADGNNGWITQKQVERI